MADPMTATVLQCDRIYVQLAENGHMRKWSQEPFDDGVLYTRHDSTRDLVEALEQRAAHAEHRYYGFRQWNAAKSAAVKKLIQDRAPELWPDFAAVSVNGSIYSEGYTMQPTFEREMNILRHRAEAAEERATKAEIALATLQGTER